MVFPDPAMNEVSVEKNNVYDISGTEKYVFSSLEAKKLFMLMHLIIQQPQTTAELVFEK